MMLRLPVCLLALLFLFVFSAQAVDIYVSPTGSDRNDGSIEKPFGSIAAALRKARELRRLKDPAIRDGVHIILAGGPYQLEETLFIRAEDAGTANSPTVIEAAANAVPILSGGQNIAGWRKLTSDRSGIPASSKGKVWVADIPTNAGRSSEFRQLWVNGKKAIRAKSENGSLMNRILSWNKTEQSCWIPTPKNIKGANVKGVEMFIHQWWAIAILRVKKMENITIRLRLSSPFAFNGKARCYY